VTIAAHFIPEPLPEFGSGQKVEHPQDGLFLYGQLSEEAAQRSFRSELSARQRGLPSSGNGFAR
jgi:hypothetical protein